MGMATDLERLTYKLEVAQDEIKRLNNQNYLSNKEITRLRMQNAAMLEMFAKMRKTIQEVEKSYSEIIWGAKSDA